jgi:TP901 family phage tail tape measure protein
MPLGVRDILLIIRAQDLASREIGRIGSALGGLGQAGGITGQQMLGIGAGLTTIGAGIAGIGAAGLAFFGSAVNAAKDYNREVALTLTQVDEAGVSLARIGDIGKTVAKQVPAPFKEMQTALFDIFSSMNVNTLQAEALLKKFSEAAVAGQTDVQTASRASIAIMNGFKIPVEDVNRVMDVQFETVRKGVITYEEYASTIGRAIPSAVRAGQSIEGLSGMIAFLTRNGQSAAMSATAAARALDLLSNPVFEKNMKKIGLTTLDSAGNFRPMVDVMQDLKKRMEGMNAGEKSKFLKDLTFGAGGTIQAMRFLNLAVTDTNGLLPELTAHIKDSSGAADAAYKIMKETPAMKIQELKNHWDVFKVTMGEALMPALEKFIEWGSKVMDWIEGIDPKLMNQIVIWGAIASGVAVVVGGLLIFLGVAAMVVGAFMLMGASLGTAVAIFLAIPIAIAAIIAAVVLLIQHWDTVKAKTGELGETFDRALNGILNKSAEIWANIKDTWVTFLQIISDVYNNIMGDIKGWWDKEGVEMMAQIEDIWNIIYTNTKQIWDLLGGAISNVLILIMGIVGGFIAFVNYLWDEFGDNLLRIARAVWDTITEVIRGALNFIFGIVKFVLAILDGEWGAAWDALLQTLDGAWDAIYGLLEGAATILGNLIGIIIEAITSPLGNLLGIMYNLGRDLIEGFVNGIKSMIGKVGEQIGKVTEAIRNPLAAFKFGSPSKVTTQWGKWIGEGLANGISDSARLVAEASEYLAAQVTPPSVESRQIGAGVGANIVGGLMGSAGSSRATSIVFAPQIDVHDATDPIKVGTVIDEKLRAMYIEIIAQNR